MNEIIKKLQDLLKRNRVEDLLDLLGYVIKGQSKRAEYILLEGRYFTNQGNQIKGILSNNEYQLEDNKIKSSLLLFIERLEEGNISLDKARALLQDTLKEDKVDNLSYQAMGEMSMAEIRRLIALFESKKNFNEENGDIYFGIGLCYLQLKTYDLAIRYFQLAIDFAPGIGDNYYYWALSTCRGRNPYILGPSEVKGIIRYIETAKNLSGNKGKYLVFTAILLKHYYYRNGLQTSLIKESFEELIDAAKSSQMDLWEVKRLFNSLAIEDTYLSKRLNI